MQAEAQQKYETMMREAINSKKQYVNPFKALLGLVDSVADFATGTTQMAALGACALVDKTTGSTDDEVSERVRHAAKGTAAERVFGP
jgi:hypothetical protein